MNQIEQEKNAKLFAEKWLKNREGYEKGETSSFWFELLGDVLGAPHPTDLIVFEQRVKLTHTSFIDAKIPSTRVLIEQKSAKVNLRDPIEQSDKSFLTPFQQAKRYWDELGADEKPRWIVISNFHEFHVHDMNNPRGEPTIISLKNFEKEWKYLAFLVDPKNENIHKELELSVEAGEIVGRFYDSLLELYGDKEPETLKALNVLCVRLVFCMYAEDSGLFPKHLQFYEYMKQFDASGFRDALQKLFKILNTEDEKRSKHERADLLEFPYVNGGLFAEDYDIPQFDEETVKIILEEASSEFDWSDINPTIFGAVFESTLNPETRRQGGMHYTSVENIEKVIKPLFLDELQMDYESALSLKSGASRNKKLRQLQEKISKLTFLDPACGSGNFLTQTYLCLRKLENNILRILTKGQKSMAFLEPIKVKISQFYGIEINDFAVTVAKTALWIAESKMMKETESIVEQDLDFLPLKSYAHIVEGNALRMDWNTVIPSYLLTYIMGNPPFFGARLMTKSQKEDVSLVFGDDWKNSGNLDYVSCWFKKCSDYMQGTTISAALVATNSVSQGDSVATLWKPLLGSKIFFDFAYRTFRWDSESSGMAHVHCVIIGFKAEPYGLTNRIFTGEEEQQVSNINAYLVEGDNVFIENRPSPISSVPDMGIGNQLIDDGNYLFKKEEMEELLKREPGAKEFFHPFYGAQEFIDRRPRYCLLLRDCPPEKLNKLPLCKERIALVEKFRSKSSRASTRKLAAFPKKFQVENFPDSSFLLIPRITSERRRYIPMGFMEKGNIASDQTLIIPDSTLYHFGVLTSSVHMAWMRTVAGRLEMRYRYSKDIVYNNFPWPVPTEAQKLKIEKTAQAILDSRNKYPESSLADLYNPQSMPDDVKMAHINNDKAVLKAYGFRTTMTEAEIVAELFKLYEKKIQELAEQEAKAIAEKKEQKKAKARKSTDVKKKN